MIIVDFNQVCISNLMAQVGNHTDLVVEEDLVRHMILNSLRLYKQKFGRVYGQMVIACDDKNYWRKQIFPYYKAGRKKSREESDIDWAGMFEVLNKIRQEVKDNLPYTVIQVENCEADDIIATLCSFVSEDIIILSADKDFIQLHRDNIIQFDPIRKRNVQVENPARYLKELVIRGDSGDGVPNALSPDNSFVDGIKQKPVRSNKLDQWLELSWDQLREVPELKDGIDRNRKLIDLFEIPLDIKHKIGDEYINQTSTKKKVDILGYLQKHKLKSLIENINDFV
jgi:5'-3' exonuclease